MKLMVVVVALVAMAMANPVTFYKLCKGPMTAKIESVDIAPCKATECYFALGKYTNLTLVFTPSTQITAAKPHAYAYLIDTKLPAPFKMEDNSCEKFSVPCPLQAGQKVTYFTSVYVDPSYPKVRTVAEWSITDQDGKDVFCFDVPVGLLPW